MLSRHLSKKFTEAKREKKSCVDVWGTGSASREFLYVDDAARGIVLATEHYNKPDAVNLGSGMEITIRDLVNLIQELTGFSGEVHLGSLQNRMDNQNEG